MSFIRFFFRTSNILRNFAAKKLYRDMKKKIDTTRDKIDFGVGKNCLRRAWLYGFCRD